MSEIKLKIRFEKWDRAVVIQNISCEEMHPQRTDVFSNDNMKLHLGGHIDGHKPLRLDPKEIIIMATSCGDIDYKHFTTNIERDKYYDRVIKLFEDYCNRDNVQGDKCCGNCISKNKCPVGSFRLGSPWDYTKDFCSKHEFKNKKSLKREGDNIFILE